MLTTYMTRYEKTGHKSRPHFFQINKILILTTFLDFKLLHIGVYKIYTTYHRESRAACRFLKS